MRLLWDTILHNLSLHCYPRLLIDIKRLQLWLPFLCAVTYGWRLPKCSLHWSWNQKEPQCKYLPFFTGRLRSIATKQKPLFMMPLFIYTEHTVYTDGHFGAVTVCYNLWQQLCHCVEGCSFVIQLWTAASNQKSDTQDHLLIFSCWKLIFFLLAKLLLPSTGNPMRPIWPTAGYIFRQLDKHMTACCNSGCLMKATFSHDPLLTSMLLLWLR